RTPVSSGLPGFPENRYHCRVMVALNLGRPVSLANQNEGQIPREGNMKMHLLMTATALAMGLASPAMAQQSMHRYVALLKYSDSAVKAMMENPQDRSAQGAKLAESFGGKMVAAFFFPGGGEFDGMVINRASGRRDSGGAESFRQSHGQL